MRTLKPGQPVTFGSDGRLKAAPPNASGKYKPVGVVAGSGLINVSGTIGGWNKGRSPLVVGASGIFWNRDPNSLDEDDFFYGGPEPDVNPNEHESDENFDMWNVDWDAPLQP